MISKHKIKQCAINRKNILLLIIFVFLNWVLIYCFLSYIFHGEYNNPKDYQKALNTISNKNRIEHFPKQIPNNVKNIIFYRDDPISFFGSEVVSLQFSSNDKDINDALKNLKYIKKEGPFNSIDEYSNVYVRKWISGGNFDFTGYIFYVIGDNTTEKYCDMCEYGVAVNKRTNTIIYYASMPD